jgi:glycosyltransferase involved in cell wall biosynthesis
MDNTEQLAVVVPIFNEEEILAEMAEQIAVEMDRAIAPDAWHFVFIDNGSTDRTPDILRDICRKMPATVVIELEKADFGAALKAGLLSVKTTWAHIINIEQWDMVFLPWAWKMRDRYDLFLGSKRADPTLNGQTSYRRLLSWGLNSILMLAYEYVGADTHGPKLLNVVKLKTLIETCKMTRGQFDTELVIRALRAGHWIAEAPTVYREYRTPRNWMIKKIFQNAMDQFRMLSFLRKVPYNGSVRFHRYARFDLETETQPALTKSIDGK